MRDGVTLRPDELRLLVVASRDLDGLRAHPGIPELRPEVAGALDAFRSNPTGVTTDLVRRMLNGNSGRFWELVEALPDGATFAGEAEAYSATARAEPSGTARPHFGIVPASSIAEKPTEWDWPGYIVRGALNLVEGNPETGKTLLVVSANASLSAGRSLPHGPATPGRKRRVLYLTAEDSISKTIVGRLKAAEADLDNVLVQEERGADLVFAGAGIEEVRQIVRGEGISAITLDPLNAYLNGVDINKEQEVRAALRPIRDFAEDENVTIIGLRHLNKASDKPALYRGGGSIALAAVARSVLLVARHPDDNALRVLLSQKCNLIEEEKRPPLGFRVAKDTSGRPRVEWLTDELDIDADTLLAPPKPGPKPDVIEKAKAYVRDHLQHGPKPRCDVVEAGRNAGLNEKAIDRAAAALGVKKEAQGRERVWSL
ncbi:MAG: AAA family ATPase [Deltaproteobacteria bacterium]|nr:AAA family ATPase [Deltaproteobacteria bacterium]